MGAPTAALFAALFVGIGYALLATNRPLRVPARGMIVGQAVIGVALGAEMQPSTLRSVQVLRIFVMMLAAPPLVRLLAGQPRSKQPEVAPEGASAVPNLVEES